MLAEVPGSPSSAAAAQAERPYRIQLPSSSAMLDHQSLDHTRGQFCTLATLSSALTSSARASKQEKDSDTIDMLSEHKSACCRMQQCNNVMTTASGTTPAHSKCSGFTHFLFPFECIQLHAACWGDN